MVIKISYNGIQDSKNLTKLVLKLDTSALKPGENITFIVETPFGSLTFTLDQVLRWFGGNLGEYTITLEKSSLKVDIKKGEKELAWYSSLPMGRISVPHSVQAGEHTGELLVIDSNGNLLPTSKYESKMVHAEFFGSGKYGTTSDKPISYSDTSGHWAKPAIDFVNVRSLISPAGNRLFAPDKPITRAEYITALGKLGGVDVSGYKRSSFTDVENSSVHMGYIEWAVKKGLAQGYDNGEFKPGAPISREESAVMTAKFANSLGYSLPQTYQAVPYSDGDKISEAAKDAIVALQRADVLRGRSGNAFNPQNDTTRAEAADILHRFCENVMTSRKAEGWSNANIDLNKRVYYSQNGIEYTGWRSISGNKYYFDKDGIMQTGWANIGGKRYYFERNGQSVNDGWTQINDKWYYFYRDGALAVNTTIGEYTVDGDGVRK